MSVRPSDFLSLSEFSQESTEIQKRNAISRSYYAAYHMAEKVRITRSLELPDIPRAGLHKKLCVALQKSGDDTLASIGADLNRQRRTRHEADYAIEKTIGYNVAKRQTDKNKTLFERLSKYLPDKDLA
jgi:uncharacterized protein (UPF0332 family)